MLAKTIEQVKKDFVNEGIVLGKRAKALETALTLKKKGIDIKTISEATELSQAEIKKLK